MGISYDPTKPAANDKPANDQAPMQTNFASIKTLIDVDHVDFSNGSYGMHQWVQLPVPYAAGATVSVPRLFTNTVDGAGNTLPGSLAQFFAYNAGTAGQCSSNYVSTAQGSVLLFGGIILKWGTNAAAANTTTYTFPVAFPNNCFGVQITINIASTLQAVGINGFTKTGYTFRTAGGAVPITYFAIGN